MDDAGPVGARGCSPTRSKGAAKKAAAMAPAPRSHKPKRPATDTDVTAVTQSPALNVALFPAACERSAINTPRSFAYGRCKANLWQQTGRRVIVVVAIGWDRRERRVGSPEREDVPAAMVESGSGAQVGSLSNRRAVKQAADRSAPGDVVSAARQEMAGQRARRMARHRLDSRVVRRAPAAQSPFPCSRSARHRKLHARPR